MMTEFALIFRQPVRAVYPTESELKEILKEWDEWIAGIAAQGKYIPGGRLENSGKVLKPGGLVTDGPFVEIKEELGGFIFVLAEDIDEATTLAHGCPIFKNNGSVEIRPINRH